MNDDGSREVGGTIAVIERRAGVRTRGFQILSGLLGLTAVVFTIPFAIVSFFDDEQAVHQMHNVTTAVGFGIVLGAMLLVAARRPREQIGAFWLAAALALGTLVAGLISGDAVSGGGSIPAVAVLVLYPHWEFHHYSGMAATGISIPLAGVIASFPVRARRPAVWAFGLGLVAMGLASLILADHLGAFAAPWAWLSIVAGIGYIAVVEAPRKRWA